VRFSPYKYKANNIFTQLHQTRDCCYDEEQFSQALSKLCDLFARNSYPKKLVGSKIFYLIIKTPLDKKILTHFALITIATLDTVETLAKKLDIKL
jgi:hypothetical protein